MATLTLNLEKPGEVQPPKLRLSLDKGAVFKVSIFWDCDPKHEDDLDCHALAAYNDGNGAKFNRLEQILSTYNTKKMSSIGVLDVNTDGSFSTAAGALTHSGDKRRQKNTEVITIKGSLIPDGINEIPLFATVHEADHGEGHEGGEEGEEEAAFSDIEVVTVTIADERGRELGKYTLSDEFGEFNVVQLGSILLGDNGWEYFPIGRGFTGNFNEVIAYYQ
jgi:tellurium resistance protein TerD